MKNWEKLGWTPRGTHGHIEKFENTRKHGDNFENMRKIVKNYEKIRKLLKLLGLKSSFFCP